jgi:hypothetical protein
MNLVYNEEIKSHDLHNSNKIGSFNILEQYEHVKLAFDLSILNDLIRF